MDLSSHHKPRGLSDWLAFCFVKLLRFFADTFFAKRYGHRAIVLETVAAVSGMVGGALQHLKSLRRMSDDHGWIKILLDEAENERMHLMTFIHIARPNMLERVLVIFVQGVFYNVFFLLYLISPHTGWWAISRKRRLSAMPITRKKIDAGRHENAPAPAIAIEYWNLKSDARLRDVVLAIRDDEADHRNVNHGFADSLNTA